MSSSMEGDPTKKGAAEPTGKQASASPSPESLEANFETQKQEVIKSLENCIESMRKFGNSLLNHAEKRRKEKIKEDPEFEKDEHRQERIRDAYLTKHFPRFAGREGIPERFHKDADLNHVHHKPCEEILALALHLAQFNKDKITVEPGSDLLNDLEGSLQGLKDKEKKFNELKTAEGVAWREFIGSNSGRLFRIVPIIEAYFPDHPEYLKYAQPIKQHMDALNRLGIEIEIVPLLTDTETVEKEGKTEIRRCVETKQTFITEFNARNGSIDFRYVPKIWERINHEMNQNKRFLFTVDHSFPGIRCRKPDGTWERLCLPKVIILSPAEWLHEAPDCDPDLQIY
mgnify:CR=1 FL=1